MAGAGGQAGPAQGPIPLLEQLRLEPPTSDVEVCTHFPPPAHSKPLSAHSCQAATRITSDVMEHSFHSPSGFFLLLGKEALLGTVECRFSHTAASCDQLPYHPCALIHTPLE